MVRKWLCKKVSDKTVVCECRRLIKFPSTSWTTSNFCEERKNLLLAWGEAWMGRRRVESFERATGIVILSSVIEAGGKDGGSE